MKEFCLSVLLPALLFFECFSGNCTDEKELAIQPNILLILTDQLTAGAMSFAGNSFLETPAIDHLAESGVVFEKAYVTQPLCLPFRSSLQTSRYPHEIGTINNGTKISGDFPLLGNLMNAAGYNCEYIGKWHVGIPPEEAGYKNYDDAGKDDEKARAAVEFLLQEHRTPFFLTVSFNNPHNVCELARAGAVGTDLPDGPIGIAPVNQDELPPLPPNFDYPENEPSVIREIQKKSTIHYPTEAWNQLTWRQYLWGYYRLVEKVDEEIGKVLDALKEAGHEKNTVVIFTSDHGEGVAMHYWNQKQILYEQAVRVPFIISWKDKTTAQVFPGLVSNALEIPATILELAGVDKPISMHGISLLPVLEGKKSKIREFVVSETMFARGGINLGATGRMIRSGSMKYIVYDNGENREQLFDLDNDPWEMNNLARKKTFKKELNLFRALILDWARSTSDHNFPYMNP